MTDSADGGFFARGKSGEVSENGVERFFVVLFVAGGKLPGRIRERQRQIHVRLFFAYSSRVIANPPTLHKWGYFTLMKMITRVNRASDSMKANPRIIAP